MGERDERARLDSRAARFAAARAAPVRAARAAFR